MTEIQRCVIPHSIAGSKINYLSFLNIPYILFYYINSGDIMGASKTGSGKTLAYLVPLIERLYINKWTPMDGLGAIIILPTRELVIYL
jgi:ATP-dependent RNA helicase DDX10/DBP4